MSNSLSIPSPESVVISEYARETGEDPKHFVRLGVRAVADQIKREGCVPHKPLFLVHSCASCPLAQKTQPNILLGPWARVAEA